MTYDLAENTWYEYLVIKNTGYNRPCSPHKVNSTSLTVSVPYRLSLSYDINCLKRRMTRYID
ncbi:hypothetical protein E2C01_058753 [Portunus trituberculatus]|uniref:Uncharacterized protein n=1 Tax=Portunus trituberculatus TaxID=210409 RepID=A0A5B7H517_PORTR|nr:hypothetical protein [Portunus trituberculatus]